MFDYLMENSAEAYRLDVKTDAKSVIEQAEWAGIRPGMRVADIGCGCGKTTFVLNELVQPGGSVTGVDGSPERLAYAKSLYAADNITYELVDITGDLSALGQFDFIWVRFFLEYYRKESFEIVKNITQLLKPGGILCLIDLDHNCMNYYGMNERLERAVLSIMNTLQEKANFDPYVGRKIYSHLYSLGYLDIDVRVSAHHLIFGELKDKDRINWTKKIETVAQKGYVDVSDFEGGIGEFISEFKNFFEDPKRFLYTPLIACRGVKKP